jgi:hypothetical protein
MVARLGLYAILGGRATRVVSLRISTTCSTHHVVRKAQHGRAFSCAREKENGREIARPPSA